MRDFPHSSSSSPRTRGPIATGLRRFRRVVAPACSITSACDYGSLLSQCFRRDDVKVSSYHALALRGRAQHFVLHRGVECPPGLPQFRGKRRAELALKGPHQRLAHCDILRWLNAQYRVLTT